MRIPKDFTIKIAVPYEKGRSCSYVQLGRTIPYTTQVVERFDQARQFKIYDVQDKKVVASYMLRPSGTCASLVEFLVANGVGAAICDEIDRVSSREFRDAGLRLFPGVRGLADHLVDFLLDGLLRERKFRRPKSEP